MRGNLSESLTFMVPLGLEAHALAERFRKKHKSHQKAKQVYLNTLAVFAVQFYLRCMGIKTSCEGSLSWDSVMQTLMDVADLEVIGLGKIECLLVLPNEKVIQIPPEVCLDRIGYVAVQFEDLLAEATLLGFVKTVPSGGELPLSQLDYLEDLLIHLNQATEKIKQPIHLSQWFMNVVDLGWQTIESLLNPQQQAELVFKFRGAEHYEALQLENLNSSVQKGKILDLGQNSKSQLIALVVGLIPASREEINIGVKVYPIGEQNYLPEELELTVLDEVGITVMQAIARNTKSIQLNFISEIGERFSVKITLGNVSFTEVFLT
ncbi:hypothetical protein WA1_23800 [Scytonema hofmannii PCC 7110]|uniref:DUF1822 domain-containing protein n=1 Tax=Scytonema hofmannii PCC 7110 TaxID=128403 RepID=A0A139X7J6_9CYAN|nr:DUF1822 family protein [Scytonema hofmannii]KYC40671.1 hypothetical protein WA1_23800 [Scytonema hofmannii PCC 7110]